MHVAFEQPDSQRIVAHLREGNEKSEVTGWNATRCIEALLAALDAAAVDGYGECFWPEPTGHNWWLFKRIDTRLEVAVLYSRSSAVGWQHVFRATDGFEYTRDLIQRALLTQAS